MQAASKPKPLLKLRLPRALCTAQRERQAKAKRYTRPRALHAPAPHLQVLAHPRQLHLGRDALRRQRGAVAHAAQLQQVRRVHRARRHQHLAARRQLGCTRGAWVSVWVRGWGGGRVNA